MSIAAPLAAQLAAQAAAADGRLLDRLRDAGACSPSSAVALSPDSHFEEKRLAALMRRGLIVQPAPARYYVDEVAVAAGSRSGRPALGQILRILIVAALLWAIVALLQS